MPLSRVTCQITPPAALCVWMVLTTIVPATVTAQPPETGDDPGIPIENATVR